MEQNYKFCFRAEPQCFCIKYFTISRISQPKLNLLLLMKSFFVINKAINTTIAYTKQKPNLYCSVPRIHRSLSRVRSVRPVAGQYSHLHCDRLLCQQWQAVKNTYKNVIKTVKHCKNQNYVNFSVQGPY